MFIICQDVNFVFQPSNLFYVSFSTIIVGILIFNLKNSPIFWTEEVIDVGEDREEIDNDSIEEIDESSAERRNQDLSEGVTIM